MHDQSFELRKRRDEADRRYSFLRSAHAIDDKFDDEVKAALEGTPIDPKTNEKYFHVLKEAVAAKQLIAGLTAEIADIEGRANDAISARNASAALARRCREYAVNQGLVCPPSLLPEVF
ncbi:MAG: hypothetical protein CTY31_12540 [Hyphomicrobium sp.]|nr:MAG: hypothetical protein CTY31_12540 [Hyphomicrobium sp.]